jgi:hypothetical protein
MVFVRVTSDWSGTGCALRRGAIIEGKVIVAVPRTKHSKSSQLALSFSAAQCGGTEMASIPFLLAAVSAAPASQLSVPVIRDMGNPRGVPQGAVSSLQQLSTQMELAAPTKPTPARTPNFGEVYGIRGVTLHVAAGPERSSLLSAKDRDVALDEHAELLLVPSSVAFAASPFPTSNSPAGPENSLGSGISFQAEEPTSDSMRTPDPAFAACSPPSCSTDLPAANEEIPAHAARSISIQALGYAPRLKAEKINLDHDESIAWLGKDRVLLAFNPHRLVHREGMMTADAPLRTIHAVLLNVAENRVLGTLDCELSDSGRYLWQLSADRVLVHAGHELRIYDSRLQLKSRLLLPGPLSFLRISPNGELLSLGIIRERHSPALHAKLEGDLGYPPAEDVDVLVVDNDFRTIAHTTTTSEILPPTLLNEGQLLLLSQPKHHFRLEFLTWQGKATTLAQFTSGCTPELGSFAPDLVFVHSCQVSSKAPEFRVMRPNGQLVLKGTADPGELGQEARGETASKTFAVRFLRAAPSVKFGFPFRGTDLLAEEVRVYRAADGRRLAAIHAEAPAPSHGGYALSPDGSQLAIVADARLSIYAVPTN